MDVARGTVEVGVVPTVNMGEECAEGNCCGIWKNAGYPVRCGGWGTLGRIRGLHW